MLRMRSRSLDPHLGNQPIRILPAIVLHRVNDGGRSDDVTQVAHASRLWLLRQLLRKEHSYTIFEWIFVISNLGFCFLLQFELIFVIAYFKKKNLVQV